MNDDLVSDLVALSAAFRSLHVGTKNADDAWAELDLSMAQFKALLAVLHTGGVTSRGLAERMHIGASAVTPLVDKLEEQKLVRREDDPPDRRGAWIRPTPRALALQKKLMEAGRAALVRGVEEVPHDKRAHVRDSLKLLLEAAHRVAAKNAEEKLP